MRESLIETLLGAIVVAVAGAFLWFSLNSTADGTSGERYEVLARFNNADGIERGTDVKFAGVKVGIVRGIQVDPQRAEAVVTISIDEKIDLATDADARIISGLLGGSHIAIEQGGSMDNIAKDGSGEILYTRGAVDLLTLFASFQQGGDNGGNTGESTDTGYGDDDYGSTDYGTTDTDPEPVPEEENE